MRKSVWITSAAVAAFGFGSVAALVGADVSKAGGGAGTASAEWPKWLGPNGTGISQEPIADKWPAEGPKKLWSAKVGIGFASAVARDGKVYGFGTQDGKDVLTCFEADTGKVLWSESYPNAYSKDYPGTRASPTIDGDRIYTYGGAGQLVARELATGKQLWLVEVLKTAGSGENLTWGVSSSPFVHGDHIVVQSGKGGAVAVAVNKADGKVAWQSEAKGLGGYAQVIAVDAGGKPQLIAFGGDTLYGMDPATGKTLWKQPWKTNYDVNAATPVYDGKGNLFVASGYGVGGGMFKLTGSGAQKLWGPKKEFQCKFQPPILDGDTLYLVSEDKRGVLRAAEWPSGKVLWESKEPTVGFGGSFVRVGDKLIVQSQSGELSLVRATPKAAEVLSTFKPFEAPERSKIWSMPVVYQGKLYAKGAEELVCFDVK